MNITREKMNYDLVIVGAGPSGLSAAINFKKLCKKNMFLSIEYKINSESEKKEIVKK